LSAIAKAFVAYRDPAHTRYIKLGDGGLTDNFGISTLTISRLAYGTPYAPLTERDAVTVRRLLVIVLDASRHPSRPTNGLFPHVFPTSQKKKRA